MKVRLGIRQRVLLAFLLLAIAGVVSSLLGITVILDNSAHMQRMHSKNIPALVAAYEISRQSESISASASSLVTKRDKWERGNFIGRIEDQFNWIDRQLGIISRLGYDTDIINYIKRNKAALKNSFNDLTGVLERSAEVNLKPAKSRVAMNDEIENLLVKHKRYADLMTFSVASLTNIELSRIKKMSAKSQSEIHNLLWQAGLYFVGVVLFVLLVVFHMDRIIGRRIVGIQKAMRAVADGEKGEKIPHGGNDEISDMGAALGTFVEKLEKREKLLKEAHEDAVNANKAKSNFLAEMSHDLRTPLNAIIGFSDIMRSKTFGPMGDHHYEEYVNDINNSGVLLLSLINDVLDLSKVEAGKHEFREETLDMTSLIQSSVKMVAAMLKKQELHIVTNIEANLPMLRGDSRTITQILNNLLSNAVKFTPPDGKIIVSANLGGDSSINILVTDTGCGMPEDDIAKALRPFEQVDNVHFQKHKGTGLGLHICINLMKLFDGALEVESEVGKGTAITVIFPPERTVYAS